jgi:hypothetical protein
MDRFEKMRTKLFGGHRHNVFEPLLKDRAGIKGTIQGSPEEFAQILYELTDGDLNATAEDVVYESVAEGKKDILKFKDGSLFRVVKAKGYIDGHMIVVAPHMPSMDEILQAKEEPLGGLVSSGLMIRDAYQRVADEYRREERRLAAEEAAEERKLARESRLETILENIQKAKSGETIIVRGLRNIVALTELGFSPCRIDNPDDWIDAEFYPGMRYCQAQTGIEVLLTGREKFRPIEEPDRLEFNFLINRSDDDPETFERMRRKYREAGKDGAPYPTAEFHDELLALVKYPEELQGRTEEDLGLVADEVERVIDRRNELDKGILPYEAVFRKDTQAILDYIRKNATPVREIQKALDYFEYTGMIDAQYKTLLDRQITAATSHAHDRDDVLNDRRVKEIVADVLKKIPKESLTSKTVTIALAPYVNELGFSRLVKIRERILQLKGMVSSPD